MALICRSLLPALAGAGALACAGVPAERAPVAEAPGGEAQLVRGGEGFGSVVVRGVNPRAAPAVVVRVGDDADAPPLAGTLTAAGDSIRFVPRFPPGDVGVLRVRVGAKEHRFAVPAPARAASSTHLVAISPSTAQVPANQLRWYLEFSAPMREGESAAHARLVDAAGRGVDGAFLRVEEELWDPARRRLTLLFDMGRVKRGIRLHEEAGSPIVAGREYAIVVDPAWRDARGAPLRRGGTHRFRATAPDYRSPDPEAWLIDAPPADTRAALDVTLDGAVDRAMGEHLIGVWRNGERLDGTAALGRDDARWTFTPAMPWSGGTYELHVRAALEDPAGNSVGRAFEIEAGRPDAGRADTGRAEAARAVGWVAVPFAIRPSASPSPRRRRARGGRLPARRRAPRAAAPAAATR